MRKVSGDLDKFEAKLRPGDVLLTSGGSVIPWRVAGAGKTEMALRGVTQKVVDKLLSVELGPFVHAAIYTGDGKIIDAHPAYGVRESGIDALKGQSIKALRPDLPKEMRDKAVNRARAAVGTAYSTPTALKAWARMHFEGIAARDLREKMRSTICSGLVANAYLGKLTPWKHRDLVVPPDFDKSPLLNTVATITKAAAMADEFKSITDKRNAEPDLEELRRLARIGVLNRLEGMFAPPPQVTPEDTLEKAHRAVDLEKEYLSKRYTVAPLLHGSLPLKLNAPGDVDIDLFVRTKSPKRFEKLVSTMERDSRYKPSSYNEAGTALQVFRRPALGPEDFPVDVAVAYGPPAQKYVDAVKTRNRSAASLPDDLRQELIRKRVILKSTPFDVKQIRYKRWKANLNEALGDPTQMTRVPIDKVGHVIDVRTPEGADQLRRFVSRKDVYGHSTHHPDEVLSSGKITPSLELLRKGQLKTYEAGSGGKHRGLQTPTLNESQLDRFEKALLQKEPDDDTATDVSLEVGAPYNAVMGDFLRRRHGSIRSFLNSGEVDPDKFRRQYLSIPKLSPYVFVTKGGVLETPRYGDTKLLVRTRSAKPSPFLNVITNEHVVDERRPLETRQLNVKSGVVIAPESKVNELQKKYPDYNYVVKEHIPDDVKDEVFLPTHRIGEVVRWVPAAVKGQLKIQPK